MESEQVEVRAPLPTLTSLDEEFGGANKELVSEQGYQPNRPRRHYGWFLLATAVLGMTSAVIWPNNALQLWSFAQSLPSSSAEQTASRSSAGSAEPLIELDGLKKEISELRNWQQQISAEITTLQSAQQDLQRFSVQAVSWYSEPNGLLHQQIAAAPKPRAAAPRTQTANTQPRPATQEANAEPGSRGVPLPLIRSQTPAPGAVPIR
jgi:cell division protein FtsB